MSGGGMPTRRGFTLIELMVAVLVGAIVVAGIYMMYSVSAKGYRIQGQTLDALGQLRTAVHQIRADLRSAGFNAPSQSAIEPWVTTAPNVVLSAVAVEDDEVSATVHEPTVNTDIDPQTLRILGDFWAHRSYQSARIVDNGATSTVTLEWVQGDPPSDTVHGNEAEFARIFTTSRFLRVEPFGVARAEYVFRIVSADFAAGVPTVTVNGGIPVTGFGAGAEVTVLGYVRYRLRHATEYDPNSSKYDLVREEVDASTGNGLGALTVAEYVVDFRLYDLCFNTRDFNEVGVSTRQTPVQIDCRRDVLALDDAPPISLGEDDGNESHLLRALTVKIAARTPNEDPDVLFVQRTDSDQPLHAYDLDPDLPGAARVFEMAATTVLTGVQSRRE